jgi:hypothetical protein
VPLHQLSVTPADVSGSGLGLALNAPAPPPLATCRLDHPDLFSEQVSCHFGGELPERTHAPGYHLESQTDFHDEVAFRQLADQLRERCATEIGWLGGTFPGDSAALTALAAEPDGAGWRWQTWHLYPAPPGGTVVYTTSRWRP